MRSTIIFHLKAILSKQIRYKVSIFGIQYHTHMFHNDNIVFKVTLLSISELYGILFKVKEIGFVLEII